MEAHAQPLLISNSERIAHLAEQFPRCALYIKELELHLDAKPFSAELIEYLIKEFISSNDPCAEEILKSVEYLKDQDPREVVHAIKKTARAIYNNKINVFVSYKTKDESLATAVVKAMRGASSKLDITYAHDFSSHKDYHERSLRVTRNAHWFILLLPDPAEDWDWGLYESGLFRAKKLPGDRLICIHHEDSLVPVKIGNIDAVPATRQHLIPFLHNLLCEPNPLPGMDAINHNTMIEPIADIIADQMSRHMTPKSALFINSSSSVIPQKINILAAAMNFALRFRWEIIENQQLHSTSMNNKLAKELRASLDRIMHEGNAGEILSSPLLKAQFETDMSKEALESICQQWHQLTNKNRSGKLDIALHELNGTLVYELTQEFLPINKRLLKLISQRLTKVLE